MTDKPDDEARLVARDNAPGTGGAVTCFPKAAILRPGRHNPRPRPLCGRDLHLALLKAADRELKDFALQYRNLSGVTALLAPVQKELARLIGVAQRPDLRVLPQSDDRGPT